MKLTKDEYQIALKNMSNPWWRINNLYSITNKQGVKMPFKLNWAQKELYRNMWYCNVILKARQLGISTFICLLFLDRCLFNSNLAAGIVAHTREDAEFLFKRIKFAYDSLPDEIKCLILATNDSSKELVFNNGSSIRVGTSMRGSTLQYLHISEFGKICAKFPEKAEEIITGSLNTIAPGQYIFIESTAEGREGYFYDMCKTAQSNKDKELSNVDFKFHFFPWWQEPAYKIGSVANISQDMLEYFISLQGRGIILDDQQKNWYASKQATLLENMKREFPSTAEEAWEQSTEGTYYGRCINAARIEKRICNIPYDESCLVHTAWDLGYNDSTAIWFFQVVGREIHLIDYIEGSGESLAHWIKIILSKPYTYGKHLAPHDVLAHEYSSGLSRQSSARKLGVNLIPVSKTDIIPGIDAARIMFNKCWFDETKCQVGIKALENYRKEWNDRQGCWASHPRHDQYSHGADSFRYLATGIHFITGLKTEEQKARDKIESMKDASGMLPGAMLYDQPTNNLNTPRGYNF